MRFLAYLAPRARRRLSAPSETSPAGTTRTSKNPRKPYGTYAHTAMSCAAGGPCRFGGGTGFRGGGLNDIFDLFVNMGGGRSAVNPNARGRGDHLRQDIEIALEEAAHGAGKTVRY